MNIHDLPFLLSGLYILISYLRCLLLPAHHVQSAMLSLMKRSRVTFCGMSFISKISILGCTVFLGYFSHVSLFEAHFPHWTLPACQLLDFTPQNYRLQLKRRTFLCVLLVQTIGLHPKYISVGGHNNFIGLYFF